MLLDHFPCNSNIVLVQQLLEKLKMFVQVIMDGKFTGVYNFFKFFCSLAIVVWSSACAWLISKQPNTLYTINFCQKDNCKDWSNNVNRLELNFFDWPIPVFIRVIRKTAKLQKNYAVLQLRREWRSNWCCYLKEQYKIAEKQIKIRCMLNILLYTFYTN